jgi:hypothetical protein
MRTRAPATGLPAASTTRTSRLRPGLSLRVREEDRTSRRSAKGRPGTPARTSRPSFAPRARTRTPCESVSPACTGARQPDRRLSGATARTRAPAKGRPSAPVARTSSFRSFSSRIDGRSMDSTSGPNPYSSGTWPGAWTTTLQNPASGACRWKVPSASTGTVAAGSGPALPSSSRRPASASGTMAISSARASLGTGAEIWPPTVMGGGGGERSSSRAASRLCTGPPKDLKDQGPKGLQRLQGVFFLLSLRSLQSLGSFLVFTPTSPPTCLPRSPWPCRSRCGRRPR